MGDSGGPRVVLKEPTDEEKVIDALTRFNEPERERFLLNSDWSEYMNSPYWRNVK